MFSERMEIDNEVTQESFLAALRVNPPTVTALRHFSERYAACGVPDALPGETWNMPDAIADEARKMWRPLISYYLRLLVDPWIDTGLNPDGSESPQNRNLLRAPFVAHAVTEYLRMFPPSLYPSAETGGFTLRITAPTWRPVRSSPDSPGIPNFLVSQEVEAQRHFVGLMTSNWRERLCKCRYLPCGRYFVHPRVRALYRHGVFCSPEHARHAAAGEHIRHTRTRGTQGLVEAAALQLLRWKFASPNWQNDATVKHRLAECLCLVIARKRLQGYRQVVKANWVTHHRDLIEQQRLKLSADGR
jgi:hypothetical protein